MPPTAALVESSAGSQAAVSGVRLGLLGSFELIVDGRRLALPMRSQRVLAFLALQGRQLQRAFVAGSLWLDVTDDRASASLRSALWRLNRQQRLVEANSEVIWLDPRITVDVSDAVAQAQTLLNPASTGLPSPDAVLLHEDLLPDWYDDWVGLERERFRQLRAHALERLCDRLAAEGRFGEAIDAGLDAARIEQLRESAHRAIIRTHLAEGNVGEALSHFEAFRTLLWEQLGLEPSAAMAGLVAPLTRT